ncbi:permease [Dactylosporangium aurantiacum]|uniref:Permease n=1 Tax=Dactylosporangium aurantiacum TaxID=35754 RepID=A0A9Q9ME81_9ACTN|nr:FtsX-like permease family protein [Dactylosporangium aurantiacum]MDG6108740.1 permease [Dactylosporangium aurantiacum]UWZ51100.1 permease [Dactylosporangium aurantiacum]
MLRLLVRRAGAQWPLLAALLGVVTVGATLLGTCALLTTRTAERAYEVAAARATADEVDVTAYTGTVEAPHASAVAAGARDVITGALAPFPTTTHTRASSILRALPPTAAAGTTVAPQTYLSGMDDLPARTQLSAGRWPQPAKTPVEAVLLEQTAQVLGVAPGSRLRLGAELAHAAVPLLDITVVGVVRPLPGAGWDRDPLVATGYALGYLDGRFGQPVNVYGPLIVDLTDLLTTGATIDRLQVTAHPDLSRPTRRDLDAAAGAVDGADRLLARTLGDRVGLERVYSALPSTLRAADDQRRVTAAVVLAVAVLGGILAATALALAARLAAGVRADETALLVALGTSPRQLAATAAVEAATLAALAAALAVPASSAVHAALTHLPPLDGAGLGTRPVVTGAQVLTVVAGAFALAAVLIVLAVRPGPAPGERRQRRELLARSGADLLLVAFAGVGWWQLAAQPDAATTRADVVRVLAPALLLAAGAAVALRLVLPALHGADRLARRARGLVLPLAAFEAARRPQAVAAGLLIGLACAAGTFGVAFDATWHRSQHDQADVSVGTDLALTLTTPPDAGQGDTVADATGGTVSPAVDRGVAVGQWLGSAGDPPRLVAVDAARAGALLRGRLDGSRTWSGVGAALAPAAPAAGITVPAGAAITVSGTATGDGALAVTPRLLLQDGTGLRTPCAAPAVPLDAAPHRLPPCSAGGGLRLVAVSLKVEMSESVIAGGISQVAVTVSVPGGTPPAGPWTATSAPPVPGQVANPAVAVTGADLVLTGTVQLNGAPDAARTIVATAFEDPGPVPVAVSARFAEEIGAERGMPLSVTVGTTPVPVVVAEVLPAIPSAPGTAALLADLDLLSRAIAVTGDLTFPVDAWWVGHPTGGAADRAAALRLGTVTTRAEETTRLSAGPLRAGLPAALRLLVPAAALLLLAGVVLHVTCDLQVRALEVARLRGIGMARRDIRTVLLGQHAAVLVPLLVAGAVVGGLATRLVAPLMVRSDTGAAPVPSAQPLWPWAAETALLLLLLAGCAVAVAAVVTVQVRRADAAHLRVAS